MATDPNNNAIARGHDPLVVAKNMAVIRGRAAAIKNCEQHAAKNTGDNGGPDFWNKVKFHLENTPFD